MMMKQHVNDMSAIDELISQLEFNNNTNVSANQLQQSP